MVRIFGSLEVADVSVSNDLVQLAGKPATSKPTSLLAILDDVHALDEQASPAEMVISAHQSKVLEQRIV